jgi:hypothetical protein
VPMETPVRSAALSPTTASSRRREDPINRVNDAFHRSRVRTAGAEVGGEGDKGHQASVVRNFRRLFREDLKSVDFHLLV